MQTQQELLKEILIPASTSAPLTRSLAPQEMNAACSGKCESGHCRTANSDESSVVF